MSGRDVVDDLSLLRLAGKLTWRPMRERQANVRWGLACEGDDSRNLLRAELGARAAAVVVAEDVDDERLQLVVGDVLRFRAHELLRRRRPTAPPSANPLRIDAERASLLDAKLPIGGPKDDSCALYDALLGRGGAHQTLKDSTLARQ
jgi:hypothetical protein